MKKLYLPAFKILFFGVCTALSCSCFAQTNSTEKRVDTFIQHKMKELDIPGLALAVIKNGNIEKMSVYGFANLEWNRPVTTHTNFQIASCTKLLTSTLVMKAIYEKKLALDNVIGDFIDSIPKAWEGMQVKYLLNHSSGIRNFNGSPYAPTYEVVKSLKDSSLEYAFGTKQHYANYDYVLMGYILESIYNKPFPQIIADEIALPAAMKDGGFDMEKKVGNIMRTTLIPQRASTYYSPAGNKFVYKFIYPQPTYTAGGYYASIQDMADWAVALDTEFFFPRSVLSDMVYGRDSVGGKPSVYSKSGWIIEKEAGITYAGHSGGPGLGDILRFPKEGYTFIVLSNDGELLPTFARSIASIYIKELPPAPKVEKFKR